MSYRRTMLKHPVSVKFLFFFLLPLCIGIGRTLVRPGLPPMSTFVTGQWMGYRQYAPFAPQTTINFGITVALPQLRSYWGR